MVRDRKIKSEKVILASDHAGFKLKEEIKKFLIKKIKCLFFTQIYKKPQYIGIFHIFW